MATGIYLSAMTSQSGKSLVALGLADSLIKRADRVGFFRPVFNGTVESEDPMVKLMRKNFNLSEKQARGGVSLERCRELLAEGNHEEMSSIAVSVYGEMAEHCDVIIIDGTDLMAHNAATVEFDLNAEFSRDLGVPVIAVVGAQDSSVADINNAVDVARTELHDAKVDVLAIMVNRCAPELVEEVEQSVKRGPSKRPVYVLPEMPEIAQPSVREVVSALDLNTKTIEDEMLDRDIHDIKIAAMTVSNFLAQFEDGDFVIVPGDRTDVMVATLASALSPSFPAPAGMLLTGGFEDTVSPDSVIGSLVERSPFPVFRTDLDTFKSGRAVAGVHGNLSLGQPRKVAAALGEWSRRVDEHELLERLELERPASMTPLRFLHNLIEKARSNRRAIVLPEGQDPRILRASEIIVRRDFCDIVLLGDKKQILEVAQKEGIDLPIAENEGDKGIRIIDLTNNEYAEDFAATYAELRAHKGMTLEGARNRMSDPSYFGTMMVYKGLVDGMVSGAVNTTANTIRPSLEFIKTREGVKVVSSVFLMLMEDRVLVFGDCAVNPNPNSDQLADIAKASAETARQFGVDPKVAMLSYSTGTSGAGADVEQVVEATEKLRESNPNFAFEGPIQFDAASNASIAASKLPDSDVAGQATVFIFPDLNTGNNTYKAVQQTSGAVAVGPVLQGLRKPVNDLSRGCTVEDIVNTVAITAIQAQTL
ncbi:phosphate acetyltransferase [Rothia terrae]|uniref:Phosphate acetyltransferase n=1 Tax=Rothia terrae TaxID=396015 RepID=A0A7H2BDZ1_9MICC|nr:phosphate acetyltransferase [Rothia terrae]NKZ33915.1 phosphate acetyltransferase [Rothia terrae]QNV37887.1 phosphate acetyltransferase [Rothia terrae]